MNRPEKEILDRGLIDWIIGQARVCRLGMCRDNIPYVVPLNFGYDGAHIFFHTSPAGLKTDFLAANPYVCFEFEHEVRVVPDEGRACAWTTSYYSAIGWGRAVEISEPEQKRHGLGQIMGQYSRQEWSFEDGALSSARVWRIAVEKLTGKRSLKPEATR